MPAGLWYKPQQQIHACRTAWDIISEGMVAKSSASASACSASCEATSSRVGWLSGISSKGRMVVTSPEMSSGRGLKLDFGSQAKKVGGLISSWVEVTYHQLCYPCLS